MPDPGQLSSYFLAGPQLVAAQLDVDNDLVPYFKYDASLNGGRGGYIECVVSPHDLYLAMSA